ncbi:hypothetical protein QJS10_CPB14g00569 [Acorus calamus]|uniref:Uncharacterized protein n=1 Tax=Acorus calamus TaxID=4465 RepID=A0AAV9DAX0_ACOCL|nr:hypothetical protein QJS10_CPB14g00569 [Acorus calamus]
MKKGDEEEHHYPRLDRVHRTSETPASLALTSPSVASETPTTPDADTADLFKRMKRSGVTVNSFVLVAALGGIGVGVRCGGGLGGGGGRGGGLVGDGGRRGRWWWWEGEGWTSSPFFIYASKVSITD